MERFAEHQEKKLKALTSVGSFESDAVKKDVLSSLEFSKKYHKTILEIKIGNLETLINRVKDVLLEGKSYKELDSIMKYFQDNKKYFLDEIYNGSGIVFEHEYKQNFDKVNDMLKEVHSKN